MLLFAIISASQFFVTSPEQLLALRLLLGLVLGFDYVVSKSLVTEFAPRRYRGRLLSILAVAWAGGYVAAYLVGFAVRDIGPDAWRLMLALSGLPAHPAVANGRARIADLVDGAWTNPGSHGHCAQQVWAQCQPAGACEFTEEKRR
jgi:MFS family permease